MIFPIKPESVQIEISNRCNLECPLCPKGRNEVLRNNPDIDVDFFRTVLDKLKDDDPRLQLWNYGEPLLHKNIFQIVNSIKNDFSDCSISTNGTVMNDRLAKVIVNSGITDIIFAIDGISQESYGKYRVGGSLKTVLNNLHIVSEQKKRFESDIKITVQFIIFKHNFGEIPKLGDFFYPMGVDNIKTKSAMLMLEGTKLELINAAKEYLYLEYPGERYEIVNNEFVIKGQPLDKCPAINNSFVITTDRTILPCCWDYNGEYPMSDNLHWKQVREIINSKSPPQMCKKCPILYQQTTSWNWNKVPRVDYMGVRK